MNDPVEYPYFRVGLTLRSPKITHAAMKRTCWLCISKLIPIGYLPGLGCTLRHLWNSGQR